ncbi:uncharacterized protein LOC105166335 isoform X1 [Sesamum indicum]|uniref:Uncharacterized protein LOC105166335 isoform X1 n=1 Tax=Sesamum indicum TaxID=4182 RepID=A0A6I9TG98_SESIN|nr:uncharacterized protein LOC105166335 isoform X1 [Sesamum indicum]
MATSAFKSTTKRAAIGGSSSGDSSRSSLRRSRSLSRFSRPIEPEPEPDTETDYNKNVPRGKFVNTTRGSKMPFPEISLDDLALEFFSSSSKNDNESDGGVVERNGREGRSVSRRAEIGRWASDTASSRRRGRSVSRARGNVVSSNSASAKNVISSDAGSRRRRSLSVARYQISDSESEVDHSQNSRNRAYVKAPISGSNQMSLAPMGTASNTRRLARSRSHKDLVHDGYSSHSSALTDEESKDTHIGKNGYEKIIKTVYAQKKAEHPTENVGNGGFYEAMRKELRYAVEEIRTELNQVHQNKSAMGRNQTAVASSDCLKPENSDALQDFSRITEKYAPKFEQEKRGQAISKMVKGLPHPRTSAIAEKPSRARKRSSDRSRTSKRLIEEAERIFEDFLSNVEDTDISSLDGERSDGSSSFGGMMKGRDAAIMEAETYRTPAGSTPPPVEMDGVILPWLQWETSPDGSLSGKNKTLTPMTPKTLEWNSEKDVVLLHDPSSHSVSSQGSSSPALFNSPFMKKREEICKSREVSNDCVSCFDMEEYLNLQNNDELLFEMYRERNRINSGGLLLCTGALY